MVQHCLQGVQFCNQTCPLEITFQRDPSSPGGMERLMLAMLLSKKKPRQNTIFVPAKDLVQLQFIRSSFLSGQSQA